MDELITRDCPFCETEDCLYTGMYEDHHVVICGGCGAEGPTCESEEEAVELWNNGVKL